MIDPQEVGEAIEERNKEKLKKAFHKKVGYPEGVLTIRAIDTLSGAPDQEWWVVAVRVKEQWSEKSVRERELLYRFKGDKRKQKWVIGSIADWRKLKKVISKHFREHPARPV